MRPHDESQFTLDRALSLRALDGQTIEVFATVLRVAYTRDTPHASVTLRVRVRHDLYDDAVRDGLFNTSPQIGVPPASDPGFDPKVPVWLQLQLRPALARDVFSAEDAAAVFLDEDERWGLRETEAWRLLSVVQSVQVPDELGAAKAQIGYQTGWARAVEPKGASICAVVDEALAFDGRPASRLSPTLVRIRGARGERRWTVLIRTDEAVGVAAVYSIFPTPVPQDRRAEASLTLASIARDLEVSAVEFDVEDGELRVRTGVDVGTGWLTRALFLRMLGRNSEAMHELWGTFDRLTGTPARSANLDEA